MAIPTQGGLGQASAAQAKPPPQQSGGKFDTSAVQAENLEEISKSKPTGLKDKIVDDLGDQREAMNAALVRMRASLDDRKNRMFDPVLMQAASGFLKPTKTGSFGESLGNAAEGAGVASERELIRDAENYKLEMELLGKEQEFRQQLGGDQLMSALLGGPRTGASTTAPPPASGAVMTQTGAPRVPNTASPVNLTTTSGQQQVVSGVREGRIPVTDELLMLASRVAPKLLPFFQEMRKSQEEQKKNAIAQGELDFKRASEKRKIVPRGLRTEREMNASEFAKYEAAKEQYFATGDEQALLAFYDSKGWLEPEQVRGRKPLKTGEAPEPIPIAKSPSEAKASEEAQIQTEKDRAKGAEELATKLRLQAEAAFANTITADDMIGYAKNNPKILDAMNKPGVFGAILRASEQGIKVGDFSVSLPAKTLAEANLDTNDLAALQIFAQKYADLQSRGRQLNRTPGEGAISDYETRLLGAIYALPTDSQRAVILKSEALKLQSMFDEDRFALWKEKRKQPVYTYDDFTTDKEYKALKTEYKKTLDRVREENLDLLTPKKKADASKPPAAPPKPAAVPPASTPNPTPPANELPHKKFEREKAEREAREKAKGT